MTNGYLIGQCGFGSCAFPTEPLISPRTLVPLDFLRKNGNLLSNFLRSYKCIFKEFRTLTFPYVMPPFPSINLLCDTLERVLYSKRERISESSQSQVFLFNFCWKCAGNSQVPPHGEKRLQNSLRETMGETAFANIPRLTATYVSTE